MTNPTIVHAVVDHILLVCAGDNVPTDGEFKGMVETISTLDSRITGILVLAGTKNPSLKQRSEMVKLLKGRKLSLALLSDSRLARGAITAISWFVPGVKAFKESEIDRALDHLKVDQGLTGRILSMLQELQSTVVLRKSA